jgi:hypothetical protein
MSDKWQFTPAESQLYTIASRPIPELPPRWTAAEMQEETRKRLLEEAGWLRRLWWRLNPRALDAAIGDNMGRWFSGEEIAYACVQAAGERLRREEATITGLLIGKRGRQ